MPIYYVKPDSDNKFPDKDTAPFLELADGLRAVNVPALKNISLLYQVDDTNKKMNIVLNGNYSSATAGDSTGLLIADLSDIIQGITAISMKENTNESGFYYYD